MELQFIVGAGGSGKTSYCIEAICSRLKAGQNARPLVLLVPEQASYQAERAVLAAPGINGYHRLKILSFNRLCMHLLGSAAAAGELSRIGREMVIQKVLRENASCLKVYAGVARRWGLAAALSKTIVEFHECAKDPADVWDAAEKLKNQSSTLAAMKFADLALIYEKYLDEIQGRFVNPDTQIDTAAAKIADSKLIKNADIWIDGFASFTTQQRMMLVEMFKAANKTHIALCFEPDKLQTLSSNRAPVEETDLFAVTESTYVELHKTAKAAGISIAPPVKLTEKHRFENAPALAHIEANIFRPQNNPGPVESEKRIRLFAAANARAEIYNTARYISAMVRKGSCRYRDIAVIVSDITQYRHYIEAVFRDFGIPYFLDMRKPLSSHPVVELLLSALTAAGENFATAEVMAYLKTDLASLDRSDVDVLENFCLAKGVDRCDWLAQKSWADMFGPTPGYDTAEVDKLRRIAAEPLTGLNSSIWQGQDEQGITAGSFTAAIFDFLCELDVARKLDQWSTGPDESTEQRHRQFYDRLMDVLDELCEVFSDEKMDPQSWVELISYALSGITLAFIPPTIDQVLVGSIERSRHPDLKAVFLIGVTGKSFPGPVGFDSILTDTDRRAAEQTDFHLAGGLRRQLTERQYLAYIAFTRASEFLAASYPVCDEENRPQTASGFLTDLKELFTDLREDFVSAQPAGGKVYSKAELLDMLCADTSDAGAKIIDTLARTPGLERHAQSTRAVKDYDNNAVLDGLLSKKFCPDAMSFSPGRIASFAACPYRHFCKHILNLEKRQQFDFEVMDIGTLFHRALEKVFVSLKKAGLEWSTVGQDAIVEISKSSFDKVIQSDTYYTMLAERSMHNRYLIEKAKQDISGLCAALAEMSSAGSLKQIGAEIWFDSETTVGYKAAAPSGRGFSLKGKIDRLDVAETGEGNAGFVFDYKRSTGTVNWSDMYHCLDVQLWAYTKAVEGASVEGVKIDSAGGAFKVPYTTYVKDIHPGCLADYESKFGYKCKGVFSAKYHELLETGAEKASRYYNFYVSKDGQPYGYYKTSGILPHLDFEKVMQLISNRVAGIVDRIYSGDIEVKPFRAGTRSACSYCDYRAVCRFDWMINRYNFLESIDKEQIVNIAGGKNDE